MNKQKMPSEIASMNSEQIAAEKLRMEQPDMFRKAIEERDKWQAVATEWQDRKAWIQQRELQLLLKR